MLKRFSAFLAVTLAFDLLPATLLAQQRVFARVEPNRDIAGATADAFEAGNGTFRRLPEGLSEGRKWHTATRLSDGRVFLAGGWNGAACLSSGEIFDPASEISILTGETMRNRRRSHTATLLSDGRVLIVGGFNGADYLNTAEIFNPSDGTYTLTANTMTTYRAGHTAVLLQTGKVLIAGGYNGSNRLSSAELYDPNEGTFTATAHSMTAEREQHTAILLSTGKVLIAGGQGETSVLRTAEIYDAAADTFTETSKPMTSGRVGHTATLLSGDKVLVAGGYSGSTLDTAEIYDAAAGTFTATAKPMGSARRDHTATLLSSGRVLIAGGSSAASVLDTAEIYNPSDGSFAATSLLTLPRSGHSATLLSGDIVYLAGGGNRIPLVFDTNSVQSDNISPNVVFTADSRRGFVPYTASGVVVAFSAETGEVLARITTGGQPMSSTMLADGRTLAVVSALEDRIFLIDTEGLKLSATYSFSGATFSFGSNLVVSPDGSAGFVASTGSGEVIKFALSDGRESGRLKGLQAPVASTLSNDGAILMVTDTLAEELVFVDAASMTKKTAFKARDQEAAADLTIFNRAVVANDGLTCLIASRDINGTLGSDTAFILKVATGEFLHKQKIGSEPGFTALTPDGTYWVILQELSIELVPTIHPDAATELNAVQGDPIGSASIVFSPDSVSAFYPSSANDLVFQHKLATDAVVGKVTVGDLPDDRLDQPSSLAITPDGKVVAVLNFMGDDLDLLTSATYLSATKFRSSSEYVTGLSLVNLSDRPSLITFYALNNYGEVMTGNGVTNPAQMTLYANEQVALTVQQIFNFSTVERTGWLTVESSEKDVAGYVSIGRAELDWLDFHYAEMDGAPLFKEPLYDLVLSEIPRTDDGSAELNLVNPNHNQGTFTQSRYSAQGSVVDSSTGNIAYPTNRQPQEVTAAEERPGAGLVLMAGGQAAGSINNTAETYDAGANSFSAAAGSMTATRYEHTATPLLSGLVLLAGGQDSSSVLATAEAYDPSTRTFTAAPGQMTVARARHTATLLTSGKILIAGGRDTSATNSTAETFDLASATFTRAAGAMTAARESHTATLLINGKVLLTGGKDGTTTLSSAELYDPTTGLFTATGAMSGARAFHTATRLSNGTVLIVGGHDGTNVLDTAEIYDPSTGVFYATANKLTKGRREHTATRLSDGTVLVAGGTDGTASLNSLEVYDPANGTFTSVATMAGARRGHTATRLLNDKVLIAGGTDGSNPLNTAELYDAASKSVTSAGVMTALRSGHTATRLQSETAEDGYIRMTSSQGLLLTEIVAQGNTSVALNGIDMQRFSGVYRLYAPQFAETSRYKTILNLINGNAEEAEVIITLHRPDGTVIAQPYKRVLVAGEQLERDLQTLFSNDPGLSSTTGWIEVESSKDYVVGTVSITDYDGTFLTTLALSGTPQDRIVFPVAAENGTYQTGIALLNSGEVPAAVTVELWGPGGTLDRSAAQTLAPRTSSALYLADYFPGLEGRVVGNIRIRAEHPLHAFALLHDRALNFMAAIPPSP